jgi:hypothetical protein
MAAALGKMRGIKPDIWTDESFVEVTPLARLLFIGLWGFACDNGHIENKPRQIKMRVLPADECDVADLVAELVGVGLVVNDGDYLVVPNFSKHQKIDKRYFRACPHCPPMSQPAVPAGATVGARRAHAGATASPRQAPGEHPAGPPDEGEREPEREPEDEERATGSHRHAARSRRPATALPDRFEPDESNRRLAQERGLALDDVVAKFKDHSLATGKTYVNWNAALSTWIRRERVPDLPTPRFLPKASNVVSPPDGLSPQEYAQWEQSTRLRRSA